MTVDDWRDRANCKGISLRVFFHPDGERDPLRSRREAQAKVVCHGCPVRAECLREALTTPNPWGTWGGMSERERRKVDPDEYLRLIEKGIRPVAALALASLPPAPKSKAAAQEVCRAS